MEGGAASVVLGNAARQLRGCAARWGMRDILPGCCRSRFAILHGCALWGRAVGRVFNMRSQEVAVAALPRILGRHRSDRLGASLATDRTLGSLDQTAAIVR